MNPEDVISEVLDYAASQIGITEHPIGSNMGDDVEAYLDEVGSQAPNPWCVAFEGACRKRTLKRLGIKMPFMVSASCDILLEAARDQGVLHQQPQAGDIFLVLASEHNATHGGFVRSVDGDTKKTIEGNSNNDGSREGYEVVAHERPINDRYRYIRWAERLAIDAYTILLKHASGPETNLGAWPVSAGVVRFPARQWGEDVMGFAVGWDNEARCVTFDGQPVPVQPLVTDGVAMLPIRALVEAAGLTLTVDNTSRTIIIM